MGKYLAALSEVSEKQPLYIREVEKKSGNTYSQEVPKVPKVPEQTGVSLSWADLAEAIEQSRRGAHLAYTPGLAWAWKAANAFTGRNLNSAQLCEVAQENH